MSYKIEAKTLDEFKDIQERIEKLPEYLRKRIEKSEKTIVNSILCTLYPTYEVNINLGLLQNPNRVLIEQETIRIYYKDFIFLIPKSKNFDKIDLNF